MLTSIFKSAIVVLALLSLQEVTSQTIFRGKVLDNQKKTPIKEARISISGQGVGTLSNDLGYFVYSKYHEVIDINSELRITAPGYEDIIRKGDEIRDLLTNVNTVYLEKDNTKRTKKQDLNSIGLYWDLSSLTDDYNFDKIWESLQNFINSEKVKTIDLYLFNSELLENDRIAVSNESLQALREKIGGLNHNGLSNYNVIEEKDNDAIVLVSNGAPTFGEPKISGDIPYYPLIIGKDRDETYLNSIISFSNGKFIGIRTDSKSKTEDKNTVYLKGKVTSDFGPLQGVNISKRDDFKEYFSGSDGSFEIPVKDGDMLKFDFIGMASKEFLYQKEETTFLEVELNSISEILEEVILLERQSKSGDVVTAQGIENKDRLGYKIDSFTEEQIRSSDIFVSDILRRAQFPGVVITGFGSAASISIIRSSNLTITGDINPLYVIDGVPITNTTLAQINLFIDAQNVKKVSIVKSLAGTTRYGSLGRNGVIFITTKSGSGGVKNAKERRSKLFQPTGRNYTENLTFLNEKEYNESYISDLKQLSSLSEQFTFYKTLEASRKPNMAFYIDMAQYFMSQDKKIGNEILEDLIQLANTNAKVLRVVAYLYEASGENNKARLLYERIAKLAPREAQSYRDLALIYKEVGEYNKSLELYINMLTDKVKGIDFTGIQPVLQSELSHLVAHHKNKIAFDRLPNEWLRVGYRLDLRMALTWSDRTAPFEFQFVNPKKKYFNWTHTIDQNKRLLLEEQNQGFQSREFIVDDAPSGDWLVNIQYLGEADEFAIPPYLKYTVYHNYGTPQETKEIKVVKLYLQEEKVTLSKISS